MSAHVPIEYRPARATDAPAVAALHADSWRRHYRGAYSDAYLDSDVVSDRLAVWTDRLGQPQPGRYTIVAESAGQLVGFAHVVLDDDLTWGALLDNLHVTFELKRHGIGTRLMAASAQLVIEQRPSSGLYLWVQEQNAGARAFYQARGGVFVERAFSQGPGGDPSRVVGTPAKLRCAWADPALLVRAHDDIRHENA